ncbi:MAG: glycosyltransferase family 2 protein [Ilumatobacter sp.]|nr:glycosyltransferase family 2 protein [Ilumatobacter sp.]
MTRPSPRVSIVVPAFNRERFLGRTLDSVLGQSFTDWELVVSNDGSTDDTKRIADEYAAQDERISVVDAPNGGVAMARNRGLAATDPSSEFVVCLDSDDRWFPDTLERLIAELEAHPDWISVYGVARCIDADDELIPGDDLAERMRERREYRGHELVDVGPDEPTTFAAMIHHNYPATPGLHLVRRRALEQVGTFDSATDPADDWDLALRLSRVGPIGFHDGLVLEWRRHDDTLTGTSPRWRKAYFSVLAKTLAAPDNTAEQRRLVRRIYLRISRNALRGAADDLRSRSFRSAAQSAARSADALAQLLRAAVRSRLSRTDA